MPRIRTLKPEITTDEKLAKVSRDARLTFVFAITQADDDGLLLANPRQLLAALYPNDETVTDRILSYWIKELVDIGVFQWRETLQGAPVLEIVQWEKHQKVDHKAKSLLRPNLRALGESVANVSRESREDVANVSRSDLGPRTVDRGPRSVPVADAPDPPARRVKAPPSEKPDVLPKPVCDAAYEAWVSRIGAVSYPRLRKALLPVYQSAHSAHPTAAELVASIEALAEAREADKPAFRGKYTVEHWASGLHEYVRLGGMPLLDEWGEATERGRIAGVGAGV